MAAAGTIITLLIGVVSYLWKNSEKIKSEELKGNFTFIKESLKETQNSIKEINKDRTDVAAKLAEDNKLLATNLAASATSIALQFSQSNATTASAIAEVKLLAVKAISQNENLIRNQDILANDIANIKKNIISSDHLRNDITLKVVSADE